MSVFKRRGSRFYQFDFEFEGRRYRGSTKMTNGQAAERVEAAKKLRLAERRGGIIRREPAPLLSKIAPQFLERFA